MDLDYETIQLIQEEFQNDFVLPQKENIPDSILARRLQEQFQKELLSKNSSRNETSDFLLARSLQEQFKNVQSPNTSYGDLVYDKKSQNRESTRSLIDPSWEVIDPTPDIHVLFMAFNNKFFWGKLDSVCVSWSKRMKRCAGICSYQGRGGLCHITLSEPLLKLRPRKDLIETLLHEMIHAFLFVTHNNKDRDGHGPEFHKHMYRINKEAGTNITVYHSFHDEVELYLQHWWRCDGPCQKWKPFFGLVRRSMNRAPGPYDRWWGQHSRSCGGTFIKIKSPEPKVKATKQKKESQPTNKITKFISSSGTSRDLGNIQSEAKGKNSKPQTIVKPTTSNIMSINSLNVSKPNSGLSTSVTIPSKTNNIHGFSNSATKTFVKGGTKINSNTIVVPKKSPTISQEKKSETGPNKENIGDTSIDYSVVRNHWINKFSNSKTSGSSQTVVSSKRKSSQSIPVAAKATKFSEMSSQDSLDCDSVPCPVCNIFYPIDELNRHLDICLSEPKNNCKECIICSKDINENEYQRHVNECLEKNFVDNTPRAQHDKNDIIIIEEDTMDLNCVNCPICKNQISIEELEEHSNLCKNRTKCPECGKEINSGNYDLHLADCLMKKFDEMDQNFNAQSNIANGSERTKSESTEEKISCLVCGDRILKNNLYSHLDECMKEVFDKEEQKEVDDDNDDNDDKLYNCPFCLKLITEVDMSDHIDICLKSVDGDCEAERNKTLFLSEID
ncbi:DNA-dependent metalloprotease SPRTN [Coccinella septempunctata]|uniref:DNA-dependent metalloprotease SPRTN n=1 Tax=Coccinella septempunctata TaxID=41139 RepID=UPI001D06E0F6|nr:DNA-dependent metalloprotease SPRTN [Coccinella septempunctata]